MKLKWKLKFIYRVLFNSDRWKVIIFDQDNLPKSGHDSLVVGDTEVFFKKKHV